MSIQRRLCAICAVPLALWGAPGCAAEEDAIKEAASNYQAGCERAVASPLSCASGITGGVETAEGCPAWAQAQVAGLEGASQTCIDRELALSRCFASADEICDTLGYAAPVGECMEEFFALADAGCR